MTSVDASPAPEYPSTLPAGIPELTLGFEAAGWAQQTLIQPNGPRAGRRLELTPGQWLFLLNWYAVDADGRWLYGHGVRRLAKGSGKSPFAAVLALIEFCAPVRLKDFDASRPGGCVGRPVDMPLVQIAATAESQTANTMRMVRAFAPKGSPVVETYKIDVGKTKFYRMPEGTLEVITSSFTASEGAESSFVVADETEHWKPANGGVALAATLSDNLAKSGSRMLETSNAWVPGQDSVAESTYTAWLAQEEGRTKARVGILYDAVVAPPDTVIDDPESLRAGLRIVYGDCPWVDIDPIEQRIYTLTSERDASLRKYLNWPTAARDAWITPEEWARCADPTKVVTDGDEVVLFFDGSKSSDATALIGCRVDDGHVFTLGVWEPDPTDPDDTVDQNEVDRAVRTAFDRFNVAAFFADVREWEQFTYTEWPTRYKDDLVVWAVPGGRPPQPIAWDMRSHKDEFARAVEACHAEIIDTAFTHDGDSRVARHIGNARRDPYRQLVTIRKEAPGSSRKIDAAVCVVGARMVRRFVLTSPKRKRRSGVIW